MDACALLGHLEALGHQLAIRLLLKLGDVVGGGAGALKVGGEEQLLLAPADVNLQGQAGQGGGMSATGGVAQHGLPRRLWQASVNSC